MSYSWNYADRKYPSWSKGPKESPLYIFKKQPLARMQSKNSKIVWHRCGQMELETKKMPVK